MKRHINLSIFEFRLSTKILDCAQGDLNSHVVGPTQLSILVSIDDRIILDEKNRLDIAVMSDQTLGQFKELVLSQKGVDLSRYYTLILRDRELKNDERTLGDLGLQAESTIHAGMLKSPSHYPY